MEDSSRGDLKKRLCIMEDENGLELSLGLSLGNSSVEKKSCDPPPPAAEVGSEEERLVARGNTWLDPRRKPGPVDAPNGGSLQPSNSSSSGFRLRDFLGPDAQQAQAPGAGVPWAHLNKEQMSRGNILMSVLMAKASSQQPVQSQHEPATGDDEQQELESSEQQKKFSQEARKKRKMAMDEQKKKPREDDKPEENPTTGLPPIHRVASLGAFQNRAALDQSSSMAALTSQLMNMRRTTSDPSFIQQQQQQRDDSNKDQNPPEIEGSGANASSSNNNNATSESLLGMWQLGTTVDLPSAEMINPELSSIKPGCSAELPWVSANGPGGKSVSGVAYKLFQGQYKIVCSCHGLHMSPAEFVKHASGGGAPGGNPSSSSAAAANGDAISMLSQVTPA